MPTRSDGSPEVLITIVESTACHFCRDAEQALAELSGEYPLRVEHLQAIQPVGAALVVRHRVPMLPLVLVEGRYFSHGRLPRGKLRHLLDARRAEGAVGAR